jgi:HEAT repeat protein
MHGKHPVNSRRQAAKHRVLHCLLPAAHCLLLGGCANFWDDVTSRDFKFKDLYTRKDPVSVLNTSDDGDARAKALRSLTEPKARGGTEVEQQRTIDVLSRAAISEPQPCVRIAAIETLGKFQDPRAVTALTGAYEAANQLTGDAAANVRCLSLTSLGTTKRPEAIAFLVRVAQTPTPSDLSDRERQQGRDCRLAAVRALGHYEGSHEVGDAMTRLLQTEKDVAMRDRAKETYAAATGGKQSAEPGPIDPPKPATPTPAADAFQLTGGTSDR